MSVFRVAGQIATLAGHTSKAAPPRRAADRNPSRVWLRNHATQAGTTIKGRAAILFGGAFVGMGVFILLITTGVIPTKDPAANAPMWLISVCAGVFAVPGLWVMSYGVRTSIADARVLRQSHRFPDSPWMYDYAWNERGTTYSDLRPIRQSLLFLVILGGLATPGHWIAWEEGRDVWFLWIGMGVLDLCLVIGFCFLCRATLRLVRFGRSRLRYDRFPFFLGDRLAVTWMRPRGMTHGGKLSCKLRCIQETFESAGNEGGQVVRAYAIYEDEQTIEPPMDRPSGFAEVPLSFALPTGDFDTRLRDHPPRYWQLEIRGECRGVDYQARFLAPVYAR